MLSMLMTTEYAPPEDRHELQQLLICIAGGEREALAELYRRTRTAVYGLALSYLKNAQDAQDLTQDVYVQVWNCAAQYRSTGSPMGWLLTVCRNLCLMPAARRTPCRAQRGGMECHSRAGVRFGCADERALLQGALARLADEERRIVLLHAVTGMKHREIAALLELPLPHRPVEISQSIEKDANFFWKEMTPDDQRKKWSSVWRGGRKDRAKRCERRSLSLRKAEGTVIPRDNKENDEEEDGHHSLPPALR